jgi:Na+/melibiose symporter-like transporter
MAKEKKGGLLNASARDGVEYRKASIFQLIFGMANNGCGICFYLLMLYASYIGTQGYGIVTAVVGAILTAMRIFDGFTDALIAAAFEKMSPKLPKVRIFLISGWILATLGVLLMFNWAAGKFSGTAGIVVFIIIYVVYIMGYTINGMAGGCVSIMITNDPTQRPMVGLVGTLFSYITPLVFNNIVTFAILPKYDNQYNMPMLKEACIWYAAAAGIMMLLCCIGVRKVDRQEMYESLAATQKGQETPKIGFKEMVAVLKDNKETQRYFWTCVSDKFAQQIGSQSVVTTMLNGVLIGSYVATTMIGNATMAVGLIFAFLGGVFVAKFGAKKSTVVWSWVAIALGIFMMIYCLILGPSGMSKIGVMGAPLMIYAIIQIGFTAVKMILTTTGTAMRADVVDYELERSGNYMPAIISGVYNFVDKLITSVSSLIAGACIMLIGYVNTVPQMGDKATWPILIMTILLSFGLPIIGWLINIVAMKNYGLTKERMVEVAKNVAGKKDQEVKEL